MRIITVGAAFLLILGLALSQTSAAETSTTPAAPQDNGTTTVPPVSSIPPSGVVHPKPDATADATVTPPNVDPKMAIAPPLTGSDAKVVPK